MRKILHGQPGTKMIILKVNVTKITLVSLNLVNYLNQIKHNFYIQATEYLTF